MSYWRPVHLECLFTAGHLSCIHVCLPHGAGCHQCQHNGKLCRSSHHYRAHEGSADNVLPPKTSGQSRQPANCATRVHPSAYGHRCQHEESHSQGAEQRTHSQDTPSIVRMRPYCSEQQLLSMYKTIIWSALEVGRVCYAHAYNASLDKLQQFQDTALRQMGLSHRARLHHNQAQSGAYHNGLQTGSPGRGARLPTRQLPHQGGRPLS